MFIFDRGAEEPYLEVAVADVIRLAEIHTFKIASCEPASL